MKTSKNRSRPEVRNRGYTKPAIMKRERLKEITQSPAPAVTESAK